MTLPRVPEPEVMATESEASEYQLMDHGQVNRRFVEDLIAGGRVGQQVIDLGCGPAEIPIELCRQLDDVTVMAADLSVEMLEIAKREVDMAGFLERIQLVQADAKSVEGFGDAVADTVISNSLLHHLPDPAEALQAAVTLTRPGGRLFFRDLVRPESNEEVERLVTAHAGQESEAAQQLLRQSFHAALTLAEIRNLCEAFGIPPERVQMTSDRHWTLDWQRPDEPA